TWQEEYQPLQHIQPSWYDKLTQTITLKELELTINEALTNKAPGPQQL
ncbi:3310_t:CDS:1, partial [Ambispora leptoticha]